MLNHVGGVSGASCTLRTSKHTSGRTLREAGQNGADVLLQRPDTGSNGTIAITQLQHSLGQDYIWQAISGIRQTPHLLKDVGSLLRFSSR